MPPEALQGSKTSYKHDVYGFSMILFELLVPSRDSPWDTEADHEEGIRAFVLSGKRPSIPNDIPTDCPEWLVPLIKKCWLQDQDTRPDFSEIASKVLQQKWKDHDNVINVCLKVHQGSAIDEIGAISAQKIS